MITRLISVVTLAFCTQLFAGDYYSHGTIDLYSPDGSVYFRGVAEQTEDKGFFSSKSDGLWTKNIKAFDLETGNAVFLFASNFPASHSIVSIEFPPVKTNQRNLLGHPTRIGHFRNLAHETSEASYLVIVVVERSSGDETVFVADPDGTNIEQVTEILQADSWHIDHRNSKLRVFTTRYDTLAMEEFDL